MDAAMTRHHEIIHGAVAAHGGFRPVDQGEGDAVFAAFRSPAEAVAAVASIQRLLHEEPWPTSVPLRVRIGVHVGEVYDRGGNLFGDPVNRCARLRGLGAGGQTLLSAPVYELVRDRLPEAAALVDLGEHRMKDLTRPEHVWQLDLAGLPTDFPPLTSLDRARHNLPVQPTRFIGRGDEVAQVVDLLKRERLVTVTGFGGMGKTRFALQVAAEMADGDGDGVYFVDLSSVTDPDRVPAELVAVLGLAETGQGAVEAVLAHLASQRMLLVLDNLEQVMRCADFVGQIYSRCPDVALLCTSREALRLRAEHEFALAPMTVPLTAEGWGKDLGALGAYEGVRLFVERAVAVDKRFVITNESAPAVAEIVSRLDGQPLAIELAAARLRTLSPQQLLSRLDGALTLLRGSARDVPDRHQTLQATIAWSYDLLAEPERVLLERLSVFAGTPELDAIEAVCGGPDAESEYDVLDGVTALVEKSLLRALEPELNGSRRFALLGSIREFAAAKLAKRMDRPDLEARHAAYYCHGGQLGRWDSRGEDEAVARIRQDVAEYRQAFCTLERRGDDALLSFPHVYFEHLTRDGLLTECLDLGQRWLAALPGMRLENQIVMHQVAWSKERVGGADAAVDLRRQMVAEAEQLGHPAYLAFALTVMLWGVHTDAEASALAARIEATMASLDAAAQVQDFGELLLHVSSALCLVYRHTDARLSLSHSRRCLDLSRQLGGKHTEAMSRLALVASLRNLDRIDEAAAVLADLDLGACGPLGASRRPGALVTAASIALHKGDATGAQERLDESVALGVMLGRPSWEAELVLADLEHAGQQHSQALGRLRAALDSAPPEDDATKSRLLWRLGRAHRLLGNPGEARFAVEEALELLKDRQIQHLPDFLAAELEWTLLEGGPTAERVTNMRARLADGALPWGLFPVQPARKA